MKNCGRCAVALVFILLSLGHVFAQVPEVQLTLAGTDPGSERPVRVDRPLYLRVQYRASVPIRLQARGQVKGREVMDITNASPVYPAGEGSALVWIAFRQPAKIDAVLVTASDANWRPLASKVVQRTLEWTVDGPELLPADWVNEMSAAQQRLISSGIREAQASRGFDLFGAILFPLMYLSVPAYLLLQLVAILRRGLWSLAAVPLVVMLPVIGFTAYALAKGSNLWPIYLLFCSPVAVLLLLGILMLSGRRTAR